MRKFWIVAIAVLLLSSVASLAYAYGGIDRGFGKNGLVQLENTRHGYNTNEPIRMALAPDGSIYLLEMATSCSSTCRTDVFLSRRLPDGSPDTSYAGGRGEVMVLPNVVRGLPFGAMNLAVDERGRVLVSRQEEQTFVVLRVLPDGQPDRSFGESDGRVSLPCEGCEDTHLDMHPEVGGGVLLWGSHLAPLPTHHEELLLKLLSPGGKLEGGFGVGGEVVSALSGENPPAAVAVRPDGAITLAGNYACCNRDGIYLRRFRADGSLDAVFGRRSARSISALGFPPRTALRTVVAVVPRRHGVVDVLGNTHEGAFALRFLGDGRIDRSFGRDGVKRLRWLARALAPAGSGRQWTIGEDTESKGALVFMLGRNDRIDTSLGRRIPAVKLERWHTTETSIASLGRGAVLFTPGFQFCRTYCPPAPKMTRIERVRQDRPR
jgi:uncharacterized delta-60 repeat protein